MKNLYEDFSNKVARFTGFGSTDIEGFSRATKTLAKNSFNGSVPLKDYLSYRYFDPKTENFLLEYSAAGFLLEIAPLVGVDDRIAKNLNQFFAKELPSGGFLQFLLLASSDIEDFFDFWSKGRINPDPIIQRITRERKEYFRQQAADFTRSGKCLPREFKLYVSYSKICSNCNEAALSELQNFRKILTTKLASLKLQPRICDPRDLIRICREIFEFEPGKRLNYKPISRIDLVNEQCLSSGNYYERRKTAFVNTNTGIASRAFTLGSRPNFWSLMQNINLLGDSDRSPLPARFYISYTVANDHRTKKNFIARGKRVIDSAERPYSRHNKALQQEAVEWREIIHHLVTKDNILSESWVFVASSKEEDINEACGEIITQYGGKDLNLISLDYFHLDAILATLPMQAANFWPQLKTRKLVHPALSSEVVTWLPIHAEWYGVPISGVPFIGKRGQLFNWNPYYRIGAGNFNTNIIGPSGVGKSVLLQCLADSMLAQNVRVFVLDIGNSYAPLTKLLGGEIIEFGAISTFTINPFAGLKEGLVEEDFNQLVVCAKELLMIMCGAIGEFEAASLEKAIKEAVLASNFKLDLKEFVEFLKTTSTTAQRELLQRFAVSLFSYTPQGVFGKYFSGEKSANFQKPITIFEFEHVKSQAKLISIILQTLLMQITSQFLTSDRSKKFVIIVDEAWMLLDHCAGFFAAISRNLRRYGGALMVCTQCFADLQTAGTTIENNNHRRAIFENSAWKIILPPSSFTDFEEHSEFKHKIPLLKSLSFERGQYSEMLLCSSGIDVVGRLILDPFSSAIFSTESEDFAYLNQQELAGIPMEQAIDNLIKVKSKR